MVFWHLPLLIFCNEKLAGLALEIEAKLMRVIEAL